jgi:hypothetical protein
MNSDAHTERDVTAVPAGLRGLWQEACGWVAWLASVFDRNVLKTTGVNRSAGARLSLWLLDIEGAVRRLLLAAALAFTPPAPRKPHACAAARTQPAAAPTRRHGFCIFRLRGAGQATHAAAPSARQPKPMATSRSPPRHDASRISPPQATPKPSPDDVTPRASTRIRASVRENQPTPPRCRNSGIAPSCPKQKTQPSFPPERAARRAGTQWRRAQHLGSGSHCVRPE